jgi:hypothetical protein
LMLVMVYLSKLQVFAKLLYHEFKGTKREKIAMRRELLSIIITHKLASNDAQRRSSSTKTGKSHAINPRTTTKQSQPRN